jgi:hypothetical protein
MQLAVVCFNWSSLRLAGWGASELVWVEKSAVLYSAAVVFHAIV